MFMLTAGRSRLRGIRGTNFFDLPMLCVLSLSFSCARLVRMAYSMASIICLKGRNKHNYILKD